MIFENMDRIVFAGDSVTDMERDKTFGEGLFDYLGTGYVRIMENMISAVYPELELRFTNRGISGNTSGDLLARFDKDVVDLKPDWVSICIGINDVWRQFDTPAFTDWYNLPDEYEKNLETMIIKVKGKVKGIFIASPYIIEPNREDRMRKRMDEYGAISKKLAEKHGCVFVDFQKVFEEYCKFKYSSFLAYDRVHPNQKGSTLMALEFLKHCGFDFNRI